MKSEHLKTVLKFWQEIVFIIAIGIIVFGITMNMKVSFQHVGNIIFYCIFVLLLACLVGQFFWKSFALSLWLAVILGLGSMFMFMAIWSDYTKIANKDGDYHDAIVGLTFGFFLAIGLTITAILMPVKYFKSGKSLEK